MVRLDWQRRGRRASPTGHRCSLKKEQTSEGTDMGPVGPIQQLGPTRHFPLTQLKCSLHIHNKAWAKKQKLYPALCYPSTPKASSCRAKSRERRKRGETELWPFCRYQISSLSIVSKVEIEDLSGREREQSSSSVYRSCLSGRGKGSHFKIIACLLLSYGFVASPYLLISSWWLNFLFYDSLNLSKWGCEDFSLYLELPGFFVFASFFYFSFFGGLKVLREI